MLDFSKIYCQLHPFELVTNFCTDQSCLIGLCATCICDHTQMHAFQNSTPQYENIRNTFARAGDALRAQIDVIQEDKQRLYHVMEGVRQKKETVKSTIKKAKKDCLDTVEKYFQDIERKWQQQINAEDKRNLLHGSHRLDSLATMLSKEINQLLQFSYQLNSNLFLEQMRKLQNEILVNSKDFHNKISKELSDNQTYTPVVNYSNENVKQLKKVLNNLLHLEFTIPALKYFESPNTLFDQSSSIAPNAISSTFISRPASQERPRGVSQDLSKIQDDMIKSCTQSINYNKRPSSLSKNSNLLVKSAMQRPSNANQMFEVRPVQAQSAQFNQFQRTSIPFSQIINPNASSFENVRTNSLMAGASQQNYSRTSFLPQYIDGYDINNSKLHTIVQEKQSKQSIKMGKKQGIKLIQQGKQNQNKLSLSNLSVSTNQSKII